MLRVGCAGWSLPRACQDAFPEGASHLERYARVFAATEINSSFYRPHQAKVYAHWAASVPPQFRFCAKVPKEITHVRRLADCEPPLAAFLQQVQGLGEKLACLLVQLPPSLAFEPDVAAPFLAHLRAAYAGGLALEPRHASWFGADVDALLRELRIARVLADPVRHEQGRDPGGWPGLVYLRLHGSPRVYYSAYDGELLQALARRLQQADGEAREVWCIFDNTAAGAAAVNAMELQRMLGAGAQAALAHPTDAGRLA